MAGKVTSDMIKPFSGEGDVVAWITKVRLVAKLKKIEDVAHFMPLYLEDSALAVYLEMDEADQESIERIEHRLKEVFSDGPMVAYGKLVTTKWTGESVDVYANEIRRLAGLAGFEGAGLERIVKLAFIQGFPHNVSMQLQQVDKAMTVLTVSDLLTRARILIAGRSEAVAAVAASPSTTSLHRQPSESVTHPGTGGGAGRARPVFKGRCYRCDGPHMARFCKEKRGVVVCYRCKEEGHLSVNCTKDLQSSQGNEKKGTGAPAVPL